MAVLSIRTPWSWVLFVVWTVKWIKLYFSPSSKTLSDWWISTAAVTQVLAGLILNINLKECIISYYLSLQRVKTTGFFSERWMFLQSHYYISRMRTEWIKPEWALGSCCFATEDYWNQLVWFFFPSERLRHAQRSNPCRFWTICTLKPRSMFTSSQLTSRLPLWTIAPKHLHQLPEAY